MTCAMQITTIIENFHASRNFDSANIILQDLEVGVNWEPRFLQVQCYNDFHDGDMLGKAVMGTLKYYGKLIWMGFIRANVVVDGSILSCMFHKC